MKLETRLTVLLGSLLAVFLAALLGLHTVQQRGAEALRVEIANDKTRHLAAVLNLDGRTLERFVADYTQWDEMYDFVDRPDPGWAEINIHQSLVSWKFQAAWVFDAQQREVHRAQQPPFVPGDLADFPTTEQRAALCGPEAHHFFHDTPRGLLEIRTSPIHPSDDARLNDAPHGWLFAARLWTSATLSQLGELTDSTITLEAPSTIAATRAGRSVIEIHRGLPDAQGRPLHQLTLRHVSPLLTQMIEYDTNEVLFYLLSGCALIGLTAWFLNHWVRLPLRRIGESLQRDRPELITPLLGRNDEFAHIAAMISTAEEQRLALHREVADRTYAVQELRCAIAERIKLGRDLHDGAIQSIYATGLTLQGLGQSLHPTAPEAGQRLALCVEALNNVIAQLRRHIAGLEDAPAPPASLTEGLQSLLKEMSPARPIDYQLSIDPLLDSAIPPDSAAQLLWIAREALSNALRHSHARRIALHLSTHNGEPVFTIEDDGDGFTLSSTTRRGHGLDNMTRRAEEIGAVLQVESVPGRGTRVRVELPWAVIAPESETPPNPAQ